MKRIDSESALREYQANGFNKLDHTLDDLERDFYNPTIDKLACRAIEVAEDHNPFSHTNDSLRLPLFSERFDLEQLKKDMAAHASEATISYRHPYFTDELRLPPEELMMYYKPHMRLWEKSDVELYISRHGRELISAYLSKHIRQEPNSPEYLAEVERVAAAEAALAQAKIERAAEAKRSKRKPLPWVGAAVRKDTPLETAIIHRLTQSGGTGLDAPSSPPPRKR